MSRSTRCSRSWSFDAQLWNEEMVVQRFFPSFLLLRFCHDMLSIERCAWEGEREMEIAWVCVCECERESERERGRERESWWCKPSEKATSAYGWELIWFRRERERETECAPLREGEVVRVCVCVCVCACACMRAYVCERRGSMRNGCKAGIKKNDGTWARWNWNKKRVKIRILNGWKQKLVKKWRWWWFSVSFVGLKFSVKRL